MRDIVEHHVNRETVITYTSKEPWMDIGSFESYDSVRNDVRWFGDLDDVPVPERGLSVFLSYHINDENEALIEDLLSPCLECTGVKVVCGGQINRFAAADRSIGIQSREQIDEADVVLAIATPDNPDKSPSDYVKEEVAYASGKSKLVGLFIRKDTAVPSPWQHTRAWTHFDAGDSARFIKDVLERVAGLGKRGTTKR